MLDSKTFSKLFKLSAKLHCSKVRHCLSCRVQTSETGNTLFTWMVRMRWRWTGWRSRGWRTPRWRRIVVVVGVWRMRRLRVLAKAVPRVSCERISGILKYKTNNVFCKNFPCQFMLIFIAQFVLLFLPCQKKNLQLLIGLPSV